MLTNDQVAELKPAVEKVARQAERRWNEFMPADDIEQELWLFIMTSQSVIDYLLQNNEALRVRALKRKADSICSNERMDYDHFTGNYSYVPKDVRRILENLTQERRNLDEEQFDLDEGLKVLKRKYPKYHEAVINQFWYGYPVGNNESEKKLRQRAVDKLADLMNRKHLQRVSEYTEGHSARSTEKENIEW